MPGKVGCIGVGHMGGPMAMNLLKHDFAVVVYDTDPAKVAPLQAQGVVSAASPAEVASAAERTISAARGADFPGQYLAADLSNGTSRRAEHRGSWRHYQGLGTDGRR